VKKKNWTVSLMQRLLVARINSYMILKEFSLPSHIARVKATLWMIIYKVMKPCLIRNLSTSCNWSH